jgi:hypothetical protein
MPVTLVFNDGVQVDVKLDYNDGHLFAEQYVAFTQEDQLIIKRYYFGMQNVDRVERDVFSATVYIKGTSYFYSAVHTYFIKES